MTDDNTTSTPTPTRTFTAKETPTSLVTKTIRAFCESYDPNHPISPETIEMMVLTQIRDDIEKRNQTASKTDQWYKPTSLTPRQVADILLACEHVRLVASAKGSFGHERDALCIYQNEGIAEGLYTDDRDILNHVISRYSMSLRPKQIEEVIIFLRADAPRVMRNTNRDLIAVQNGIFNYKTKELLPFSPEHVFFCKSMTRYVPNAPEPTFIMPDGQKWRPSTWLDSLSDDPEQVELFYQMISACVRPAVSWDKAVLLYSREGSNGKGSLITLMRNLVGADGYAAIPMGDFGKNFMLEPLMHVNCVLTDENGVGGFIDDSANFKAAVTGDVMQIDRKYKTPVNLQFSGFICECLNDLPQARDRSESLYRRLLFVHMQKTFKGEADRKYIKNDYLARPEVLEWFMCQALSGDFYEFSEPASSLEELNRYKSYNDPVRDFFETIVDSRLRWDIQPFNWLYILYKHWFRINHPSGMVMPSNRFRLEMQEIAEKSGHWKCSGMRHTVRVNGRMNATEPIIIELDVDEYKNHQYSGTDWDKITAFDRPEYVSGALERIVEDDTDPDDDPTTPTPSPKGSKHTTSHMAHHSNVIAKTASMNSTNTKQSANSSQAAIYTETEKNKENEKNCENNPHNTEEMLYDAPDSGKFSSVTPACGQGHDNGVDGNPVAQSNVLADISTDQPSTPPSIPGHVSALPDIVDSNNNEPSFTADLNLTDTKTDTSQGSRRVRRE